MAENIWCHCGTCKKPIFLGDKYFACTVSTCKKTAYCSMPCFDTHVPVFRHKNDWAEEHLAPKTLPLEINMNMENNDNRRDVLVVASKVKDYIRKKSGMNTSASVIEKLSDIVRKECDKAIEQAQADKRKTVMDRDF